ncbi:hypothetical protein E2P81_ATG03455 [Venturia nashicola]|uniref:Uncharacterized protein n=1 Tax=Venturia nashicola TaxID=86259 RepID=A0A4Z1P8U5_9PEZI|nr:hypothetical protein E6O75_ATG03526 [Venturia nashicola]TLD37780.1 hypothetical protein E2P81_ATG03455 [Venturia nashicola]
MATTTFSTISLPTNTTTPNNFPIDSPTDQALKAGFVVYEALLYFFLSTGASLTIFITICVERRARRRYHKILILIPLLSYVLSIYSVLSVVIRTIHGIEGAQRLKYETLAGFVGAVVYMIVGEVWWKWGGRREAFPEGQGIWFGKKSKSGGIGLQRLAVSMNLGPQQQRRGSALAPVTVDAVSLPLHGRREVSSDLQAISPDLPQQKQQERGDSASISAATSANTMPLYETRNVSSDLQQQEEQRGRRDSASGSIATLTSTTTLPLYQSRAPSPPVYSSRSGSPSLENVAGECV